MTLTRNAQSGQLDTAIFDAVNDTSITLSHSKARVRARPRGASTRADDRARALTLFAGR